MGIGSGTGAEVDPRAGVGTGSGTGVDSNRWVGAGDSCWGRSASDILASDPGAGLPPDSAKSRVVLSVVDVCKFCTRCVGGKSGISVVV